MKRPGSVGDILEIAGANFGFLESIQTQNKRIARVVARFDAGDIILNQSVVVCTCPLNPNHVYLESELEGNHVCEADNAKLDCH